MSIDLFDVEQLVLSEVAEPPLASQAAEARDRVWDMAVQANPGLWDGPVVACGGLDWPGPRVLHLYWVRVTYRHYALRRVPGANALPSVFVNVIQPTEASGVLVARMSPSTAAPGRWQLPGGSVEPPRTGASLDASVLAGQAARELAEEVGVSVTSDDLRLWVTTRGEHGSLGLTYLAPALPESTVREAFSTVSATERSRGREPELDDITFVRSPNDLAGLYGPHADYLEPITRRFFTRD
ncbi:NUDIX hydrolase [Streptomyces buecherae]|uniref:NUDIX hydrolase n=1 Tax=Streptomyces buecherae TaxID=2763006 RepID=UPI0027E29A94|nr:NUDIX hydrolase [Streptomyces buecherae]